MAVINLRNVVALGVLEDGVYPSVYNGQTGEYIGTVDGEGAGVKTVPTLYMYYRKNGHLYLYRTKERIEIDLTNVTAYDNSALFKLTEKSDISSAKITEFESRNIDVGHYEYKVPWVKSTQQYLYILVPIVRSIHTITVQGIISNQIFTLTGIYVHEGKSWWIYRTNVKTNFDFNDAVNEILDVQVYVRELTAEDLNPIEQLTKLLFEHINNKFNPHEVTKEQVGLGNVDNTADMDKPVSRPQKEYIDALENRVKGWFKQLNVWINNHVTEVNKKFQDVWAAINKKLDKEDYENDKDNFNAHIRNYDNPHRVTAAQVGLPTAASDIEKLKQKAQELQGLLINKQDKTSEELITDNKRIVDAINEIYGIVVEHNNHVRSNSINQIEVTSEIPTTFEDGTLWIRIPRNEEDYITIKIEAVPVDSTIRMINSEGKESAGVGSASLECLIQSRLHYIVEKENYITKDVYVDVGVEDTTINVVLTPKTKKTLIVNATPAESTIKITNKETSSTIATGTGSVKVETYDPINVDIEITCDGYVPYSESLTLDENITRNITLSAVPIEQGAVSLTVVDSETKAKIAAYVYDKDTDGILGQVTKDTPLQLTGDVNTSRILRFVSSGYIEVEQLVTYAIPTAEITVEMDKVPVQTGTIYATAVNTESTALDGVTFEYKLSTESSWKPLGNDESTTGKSEAVTAPVGTSVDFRASKTGYITNTGTGVITNSESSVTIVLEEVPPEPTTKEYYIYVGDSETHQPIQGDTTAYLWVTDNWVKQTLSGSFKGFNYTGEPGNTIKVKFESVGYDTLEQDVTLPTDGVEPIQIGLLMVKETPPEPTTKEYYIHAVTEESVNITTGVHGYLWNNNSWVEQTLQGGAMGFTYNGEPGTSIRVKFTATGYNDTEKDIVLEDGSTEPIDVKVVMTEETPPQPTTKEYFVFAVTEKNAPVETVTAASVLVDDEWIPQDLRTVVANIGFNYTAIPGTVIKVKFVATGFITEEIDVTLQTESDESLIIPVTLRFEDGIDYMQIEGDGTKHPIFRVGDVESN